MGSLALHLEAWTSLDPSGWATHIVRSGFRFPWSARKPPLLLHPPPQPPGPRDPRAWEALDAEVASLLAKRAIEEVDPHSPGFYSHMFVVPKSSGGWRPVLDLSPMNRFLRRIRFRMETTASVRQAVLAGDWATSVDLQDAFFHILVHPRERKWLRFVWNGKVFQFRALPFGMALSPYVFTMVVRALAQHLRAQGIRLRCYLDDWLILAASSETCARHTQMVRAMAERLGFVLNIPKCDLVPSQRFLYLGIEFDTVAFVVRPSQERIQRLLGLLTSLRSSPSATARQLASLIGMMESLSSLIPLGRLMLRPLQRQFRSRWSQSGQPWSQCLPLGSWFLQATQVWLNPRLLSAGVPIIPPPTQVELYTDASNEGWGGHARDRFVGGSWSPEETLWHINRLELRAVKLSLSHFLPILRGQSVLLLTDNTTVACYVNKQGGLHSSTLSMDAENLLWWCRKRHISLVARHIPGRLNVLADFLSRSHCVVHTEWTIRRDSLEPIWTLWFRPMIDLFATRFNHRLPLFVSPVPDPSAIAADALSLNWSNLSVYAFPPFSILQRVLRKAREELPMMILIAPLWPAQPWYPDLLELAHGPPLEIAVRRDLLLQPRSGIRHPNPGVLSLHAWRLCNPQCLASPCRLRRQRRPVP